MYDMMRGKGVFLMKSSAMSAPLKFATAIYLIFSCLGILGLDILGVRSHFYLFAISFFADQPAWELPYYLSFALWIATICFGIQSVRRERFRLYTFLVWADCLVNLILILTDHVRFSHSLFINALYGAWLLRRLHMDQEYVI